MDGDEIDSISTLVNELYDKVQELDKNNGSLINISNSGPNSGSN